MLQFRACTTDLIAFQMDDFTGLETLFTNTDLGQKI